MYIATTAIRTFYLSFIYTLLLVNCVDDKHSIPPHMAVSVLQTAPDTLHQRFQQFIFLQFAQEFQGGSANELVRAPQVLCW